MGTQRAIFLDRDGVLNEDSGYVGKVSDVKLLPGVREAIKKLDSLGFLLFVISNQSGVARGFFKEADVKKVNQHIDKLTGSIIKGFFYCPHHLAGIIKEYTIDCECRKPKQE